MKLRDAIRRKHPSQLATLVLLHHDNGDRATHERIQELKWELLEHLPYSQHLAPTDFHLFRLLKFTLVANVSLTIKRLKWSC
jgi:hypothetical protein